VSPEHILLIRQWWSWPFICDLHRRNWPRYGSRWTAVP